MSWSKRIFPTIALFYWPTALFLENTLKDFSAVFFPAIFFGLSLLTFAVSRKISLALLLAVSLIEPKLSFVPLVYAALLGKNYKEKILFALLSIFLVIPRVSIVGGQSVFRFDHNELQMVLQKQKLYPTIISARIFQNKARIITEKLTANTLLLVDPNNYLFGNHPRQTRDTQNLQKFPALAALPFLFTFTLLKKKRIKISLFFALIAIISLVPLTNFDRHDIILWIPLFAILLLSVRSLPDTKLWNIYSALGTVFSVWEFTRLFFV